MDFMVRVPTRPWMFIAMAEGRDIYDWVQCAVYCVTCALSYDPEMSDMLKM